MTEQENIPAESGQEEKSKRGRKPGTKNQTGPTKTELKRVVRKFVRTTHLLAFAGTDYFANRYGIRVAVEDITEDEYETLDDAGMMVVEKYFPQLFDEPLILYAVVLGGVAQSHLAPLPQKEEKKPDSENANS